MSETHDLSTTGLRKLPEGTTVKISRAPHVRFVKQADRRWHEVPRMGITPRTVTSAELMLLGVTTI